MAVINNTLGSIGDVILVDTEYPTTGISSIVGFTEDVQGESANRKLHREFKYTVDGANYSEWIELSVGNLTSITIDPSWDFHIKYRFTRIGSDNTNVITWNWININAVQVAKECGVEFTNSPFSFFFDCCSDEEILGWCVNVFRKMYDTGIISTTIVRGENQNIDGEDRDYIDFWRSITCIFAMIVAHGRKYGEFSDNQILLERYLEGRDLNIRNSNDLEDLQDLMEGYHDEINKRGSIRGYDEIKRIISHNSNRDEFAIGITDNQSNGWVVNRHSPLFRGITNHPSLDKANDNYPVVGSVVYDNVSQYDFSVITGGISGLGMISPTFDQGFNVDSSVVYQVKLLAMVTDVTAKLSLRVFGWNAAGQQLNPSLNVIGQSGNALDKIVLPKINEWYEIKVVVFPYTEPFSLDPDFATTPMGGSNVKMVSQITRIFANVVLDDEDSDSSGVLSVRDVQITMINTPYAKGFVGGQPLFESFIKNNSGRYSNSEVEEAIKKHVPYGTGMINTYL